MDHFGGARPKTPLNSPHKSVNKETPKKGSLNIRVSDEPDCVCILCDTEITKQRERNRLFENVMTKTSVCAKVEYVLSVEIDSIFYQKIVCRKCERECSSLEKKDKDCKFIRAKLLHHYEKTTATLKAKYEQLTVKRMSNSTPVKAKKKISYSSGKENIVSSSADFNNNSNNNNNYNNPTFLSKSKDECPSKVSVCLLRIY